ncbi:hypothetical protein Goshw_022158, partial [Gossypium schwendimanii]|nr:hypothetical protein [Gossypium schwendimanii]
NEYSNSKLVRKVLRSIYERFNIKVTIIKKANNNRQEGQGYRCMGIDELIGFLKTFEINMEEAKKGKLKFEKSIAFYVAETETNLESELDNEQVSNFATFTSKVDKPDAFKCESVTAFECTNVRSVYTTTKDRKLDGVHKCTSQIVLRVLRGLYPMDCSLGKTDIKQITRNNY